MSRMPKNVRRPFPIGAAIAFFSWHHLCSHPLRFRPRMRCCHSDPARWSGSRRPMLRRGALRTAPGRSCSRIGCGSWRDMKAAETERMSGIPPTEPLGTSWPTRRGIPGTPQVCLCLTTRCGWSPETTLKRMFGNWLARRWRRKVQDQAVKTGTTNDTNHTKNNDV